VAPKSLIDNEPKKSFWNTNAGDWVLGIMMFSLIMVPAIIWSWVCRC
jgi:hypothetical protein